MTKYSKDQLLNFMSFTGMPVKSLKVLNQIHHSEIACLNSLPIRVSQQLWPTLESVNILTTSFEVKNVPEWFILFFSGKHYLVSTQGYDYCRYMALIDNN